MCACQFTQIRTHTPFGKIEIFPKGVWARDYPPPLNFQRGKEGLVQDYLATIHAPSI